MILGLGAIAKNEGPYLLEWIAWHRLMGFDRIIICDNDSTDGSTELLAALDRAGVITHIPFPDPPGDRPQCPAYREVLRRVQGEIDWLAMFDLDEFLMPTGDLNLRQILMRQPSDAGGIVLNWAIFGSNGLSLAGDGLVTERFVRRAEQNSELNAFVKPIVRVSDVDLRAGIADPHSFPLRRRRYYARPDGTVAQIPTTGRYGFCEPVDWTGLRLNHYAVKSRTEFFRIKQPRGDALTTNSRRGSYFLHHDRNDVLDLTALPFADRCKAEIIRLRTCAEDSGGLDPEWAPQIPDLTGGGEVAALYWCAGEQCYVVDGWRENAAFDPLPAITLDCPQVELVGPHSRALHYRLVWPGSRVDPADVLSGVRLYFPNAPEPRPGDVSVYSHETLLARLKPIHLDSEADLPPLPHEAPVSPAADR